MSTLDSILELRCRVSTSVIGQQEVVHNLLIGLLANGNILMEGLPGLAKTRAVKSLAANMEADFFRIQFTPGRRRRLAGDLDSVAQRDPVRPDGGV
jgi:MoxR-like ATPase